MSERSWETMFREAYDRAVEAYQRGARTPDECVCAADREFLAEIGCTAQELFDYVEDWCEAGEPEFKDAIDVTAIRRDYFLNVQGGRAASHRRSLDEFPAPNAAIEGIEWLPRIIAKARAKLHGELPPELMYGCGGDRRFLRNRCDRRVEA